MERSDIENYIKKLKELESDLASGGEIDSNFDAELNKVLSLLSNDISTLNTQSTSSGTISEVINVKVKKLDPNAVVPSYSKVGDAGMDLTITNIKENTSFSITYGFGIAMEIPKGYVGLVFPRSSVRNQDLILSNCVGVIDSGYRGELQATFKKTQGLDSISYNVGERGAQIIILPYPQINMVESNELSETDRGDGGFGSTGK
jgi:dUTP pyrophosphatase